MITSEQSQDKTSVVLTGPVAELMLFYTVWKTRAWPHWVDSDAETAKLEVKNVIERFNSGVNKLYLSNTSPFKEAYTYATSRLRALDIQITEKSDLLDEKSMLEERIQSINKMIDNTKDDVHTVYLIAQSKAMKDYLYTLNLRMKFLDKTAGNEI